MEDQQSKEEVFDITDAKNKYEPCPKCGADVDMGLVRRNGKLAVECMHITGNGKQCDCRGPEFSGDPGPEQDKSAFEAWNAICRACYSKRLHGEHDWTKHPYSRHGYNPQFRNGPLKGWTHAGLLAEFEAKQAKKNAS